MEGTASVSAEGFFLFSHLKSLPPHCHPLSSQYRGLNQNPFDVICWSLPDIRVIIIQFGQPGLIKTIYASCFYNYACKVPLFKWTDLN